MRQTCSGCHRTTDTYTTVEVDLRTGYQQAHGFGEPSLARFHYCPSCDDRRAALVAMTEGGV